MPNDAAPRAVADPRERGGSPWLGTGSAPSTALTQYQQLERSMRIWWPSLVDGVAPATALKACADWAMHLALSPAKQWELAQFAAEQAARWCGVVLSAGDEDRWCVEPLPQDKRFDDPQWRRQPYVWLAQAFLLRQQWWHLATTAVPGLDRHHEQMVEFATRQWLDMVSPSNSVLANPVVLSRTLGELGFNLLRGAMHALDDAWREMLDQPPAGAERFQVGVDVAATPGRVVLRNRLIELIQYEPTTRIVHPEPVLLVPAWIMKYYVLDLEQHNSLVKYLVDHGYTVFAISWKNPDGGDRDLGLSDYHRLGVRAALDAIGAVVGPRPVHAAGYCLGGTLLAMAAAALGRGQPTALKSMSLFAAQTDFADPGEISLFIDESQVEFLENQMWRHGYLDKKQMKRSFQLIRSRDLVWSYRLGTYLLGERAPVSALMAWNADGTRMPYQMHSEYLRSLFLRNALASGEFEFDGVPVNLSDIRVPIFSVGAVQDHIAPWRSVFKLHRLTHAEQTFVLTAGGHNVGIVNPPGAARTSYRLRRWRPGDRVMSAEEWFDATSPIAGSWWVPWVQWLASHSSPRNVRPPAMGAPGLPALDSAPGLYVHQK